MIETIYYKIRCKNQEVDFYNEYDEEGLLLDAYSRNPANGQYTQYTKWHDGWKEQDEDLEEIWSAIYEYSESQELFEFVCSMTDEDINIPYENEYFCEDEVETKKTYEFTVVCTDIERDDDR